MTLFELIKEDIESTCTQTFREDLVLKFDSNQWESLYYAMLEAKSLSDGVVPYSAPIELRTKWGTVKLCMLVPLPPNTKAEDYQ